MGNIPAGQTFHFRFSTNGRDFSLPPEHFDFDSTTTQPFTLPSAEPLLLIQVFAGPSVP